MRPLRPSSPARSQLQFTGAAVQSVADDPTEDRTVVTVGGSGASMAVIPFAADEFDGDTLTIPAEPGGPITVTAQPFDGNLIILTTNP